MVQMQTPGLHDFRQQTPLVTALFFVLFLFYASYLQY